MWLCIYTLFSEKWLFFWVFCHPVFSRVYMLFICKIGGYYYYLTYLRICHLYYARVHSRRHTKHLLFPDDKYPLSVPSRSCKRYNWSQIKKVPRARWKCSREPQPGMKKGRTLESLLLGKLQNLRGWKGPLEIIKSNLTAIADFFG